MFPGGGLTGKEAPGQYAAIVAAWVTGDYLTGTGLREA